MPVAPCSFCAIAAGDLPAAIVHADAHCLAFLDARPLFPGHVLVVPRRHVETLPELPDDLLAPFFATVRRLARAVPAAMSARGTFVAVNNVVSQSVPHLHVHVVPRRPKDGLRGFFWPRTRYSGEEDMEQVAALIRAALAEG